MPGLFGIVHWRRAPLEEAPTRRLLDAMADRLRHVGGLQVDTLFDPARGVAIARIDRPRPSLPPWPSPSLGDGASVWLHDGVLHDGVLHDGAQQHGVQSGALNDSRTRRATADGNEAVIRRLRALRGHWAAAHVGPRRIVVSTDRCGARPLLWARVGDLVCFAPELKALLAVPGLDRTLDDGALGMFFASGFLLADRTFFRGVHRLEGGRALVIGDVTEPDGAGVTIVPWHRWHFTVDGDGTSEAELQRELGAIVERSVARDVLGASGAPDAAERAVVFLSGGKDSRMIAAAAARAAGPEVVRTISWGAEGVEAGDGDAALGDVALARRVAARLGVQHRVVARRLDDPSASFGQKALRLTYILDSLVDIGMFHGDELRLMEDLAAGGVDRVLRGDQAFTRGRAMLDPAYAVLRMCIRSTSGLAGAADVWHEAPHRRACDGSDAWIDALVRSYAGMQEDNVGDAVYLRHRLQGYLGPAGYFKQLVVDHRNPLLDEQMLDLVQRLSIASRREQRLLDAAGAETFPEVWDLPFATSSSLESYAELLARPTPVRRAVHAALDDAASSVWQVFDRQALRARLDGLRAGTAAGGLRSLRRRLQSRVKTVVRDAIYDIPALDTRVRGRYLRRKTQDDEIFLRIVALKHFVDLYVDDDASFGAFERRREALAAREHAVPEIEGGPRDRAQNNDRAQNHDRALKNRPQANA
ncbi:MAG: asparagine synthase-related protein [Acidobacteriota bacterium]